MDIANAELLGESQGTLKFIMNDHGVVFFPATQQHRDIKTPRLSYEDNYLGNAVAGIVSEGRVEIRFHQAFSDERVRRILMNHGERPFNFYWRGPRPCCIVMPRICHD